MTREDMLQKMNERQNQLNVFTNIDEQAITEAIKNEEEKTMKDQITYTEKNGRYYKIEDGKTTRIGKAEFEAAMSKPEDVRPAEDTPSNPDKTTHQYLTLRRPPMPGGIPSGAIEVGEFDYPVWVEGHGTAHGWAIYDHELTEKEMSDHEMIPYDQPLVAKAEEQEAEEGSDEEWQAAADAEIKAREDKEAADAKATEDAINKKVEKKEVKKDQPKAEKKERKPRRSKDVAFEDKEQAITLTAKQVDFILHLSDSTFWDKGLDSVLWCDVLCDEIGGQFTEKPMAIGAMISTLCEKGLATRTKDKLTDQTTGKSRKSTTFQLTIKGKLVAAKVGLR